MFFEGFEGNKAFLDQKNMGSKNHKNLHFFFKVASPCFWSKNGDYLIFSFFYAKWMRKECFMKAQKEKKPF